MTKAPPSLQVETFVRKRFQKRNKITLQKKQGRINAQKKKIEKYIEDIAVKEIEASSSKARNRRIHLACGINDKISFQHTYVLLRKVLHSWTFVEQLYQE
tara:strand:- start:32 stop:331 length:300 start_codon:yes stop_codon:yes gene_type:complete